MHTENMIDVTNLSLTKMAKLAYQMSKPVGMGILHYREGELSDEDAQELVNNCKDDRQMALNMDYVHGRCCKFRVFKENGKHYINKDWYEHTEDDLHQLLILAN